MGYKYSRDEILAAAVEAVEQEGLSTLTFGRLARRIGISDRIIVYYFPSKSDLITSTISTISAGLIDILDDAFGDEPQPPSDLITRAWPVLAASSNDSVFRAFFELVGLSGARIEPYATLAPQLLNAWATWLVPHIEVPAGSSAEAEAYRIMATIDGLLIIQGQLGTAAAASAAEAMGI